MADYRQFCNSCGNEVGFGSHKPDCESSRRVREAEQARRDWERAMFEEASKLTDDELVSAVVEAELRAMALGQEVSAMEKKIRALRDGMRGRGGAFALYERVRAELRDRG